MLNRKRNYSIDLLKTLSIFGVVYIHASGLGICSSKLQEYVKALFRFGVPCFVVIWAYFMEKGYVKNKGFEYDFLLSKFKKFLKIYLFWTSIYFFIKVNWQTLDFKSFLFSHLVYGWMGQYFLLLLLQFTMFYSIIRYTYKYKYLRTLLTVLVLLIFFIRTFYSDYLPFYILKLSYVPFIYWLPYAYLGLSLVNKKNNFFKQSYLLLVMLIPIEYMIFMRYNINYLVYVTMGTLIGSMILTIFAIKNSISFKNHFLIKLVEFIGKNTMTIFLINPLIVILLKNLIKNFNISFTCDYKILLIIFPFLSTSIIVGICLSLIPVIKYLKLNGHIN